MILQIQRSASCGHAWVCGVDTRLFDGLKADCEIVVRNIGSGTCPVCKVPAVRYSRDGPICTDAFGSVPVFQQGWRA